MCQKKVGVTGGLASGKTTVCDLFVEKGAVKIDADRAGHSILAGDSDFADRIVDLLGDNIVSEGILDRRKIAAIIYEDEILFEKYCNLVHPEIISRVKEDISRTKGVIVLDAALLMEFKLHEIMDKIIVVTASSEVQIARAVDRGISEKEAKKIISYQLSPQDMLKYADYIIDGETDIVNTRKGVNRIWEEL